MSSNKMKVSHLKRCKSMPDFDESLVSPRKPNSGVGVVTVKKLTSTSKQSTAKKLYMGRRSLGVNVGGGALSTKVRRKKSKSEWDRDIQDDMYAEDEGFNDSTTPPSTYRCIPALERSAHPSRTFQSPIATTALYCVSGENLIPPLENLRLGSDRNGLHQEISQFLKRADREKSKQVHITPRVMNCALFGQTVRFVVGEKDEKKYTFENILWLVLKSYYSAHQEGKQVIVGKTEWMEEDEKIAKARQKYSMVLDKIKEFRYENDTVDDLQQETLNRKIAFSKEYCENLRNANCRVSKILDDFDMLVELFPHQNALWDCVKLERGLEEKTFLERKLTSMRVWWNTLTDMDDKLKALAILFEVESQDVEWFKPLDKDNKVFEMEDVQPVFGAYVKKSLSLKGMKKVLERVEHLLKNTLDKAAILMQKKPKSYAAATASKGSSLTASQRGRYGELSEYRFCDSNILELNLPSLAHIFFFLLAVPMQLVIQWLEIRSRSDPPDDHELDELTFDAMITDSRDCVEEAVRIKQCYMEKLRCICSKCAMPAHLYPAKYNSKVLVVFIKYIHYVNCWSNCKSVREDPHHLLLILEKQWDSALLCARSISSALEPLCRTFSDIIGTLIKELVEGYADEEIEKIKNRLIKDLDNESDDYDTTIPFHSFTVKVNSLIKEVKERELKIFSFLRSSLNDVHDAIGYSLKKEYTEARLLAEMESDFCLIQLVATFDSSEEEELIELPMLLFVDKTSSDKANVENCLLAIAEGRKMDDGCIVTVPDEEHEFRKEWNGRIVKIMIDEETRIGYSYFRSDIILRMCNGPIKSEMEVKYSQFLECVAPSCSSSSMISDRIEGLTKEQLLPHLDTEKERIEMLLGRWQSQFSRNDERFTNNLEFKLEKHFLIAFQVHRDVAKVVSDSFMSSLGREMIEKAIQLMNRWKSYLDFKHSQPSEYLPMWATPAFTFLQFFTEPKWTNEEIMTEQQFDNISMMLASFKAKLISSPQHCDLKPVVQKPRMTRSTSSKTSGTMSYNSSEKQHESQLDRLRKKDEERAKKDSEFFQLGKVVSEDRTAIVTNIRENYEPFEWALLNKIASGSFGTVHRAMNIDARRVIAAKEIKIETDKTDKIDDEINIFRKLRHENLVKYFGVAVKDNCVYILMEYCSQGSLEEICKEKMDLKLVRQYTHSLLKGVQYLHSHQIIHCDIKPANIFLDKSCVLKLGDFGCSARLIGTSTIHGEFQATVGTPQYMAPEIFSYGETKNEFGVYRGYGRSVDIWAVGCTVIQMITGVAPWNGMSMYAIAFAICHKEQKPTYPSVAENRPDVKNFLDSCFVYDPTKRASAPELLQTTFANVNITDDYVIVSDYESQSSREDSTNNSYNY